MVVVTSLSRRTCLVLSNTCPAKGSHKMHVSVSAGERSQYHGSHQKPSSIATTLADDLSRSSHESRDGAAGVIPTRTQLAPSLRELSAWRDHVVHADASLGMSYRRSACHPVDHFGLFILPKTPQFYCSVYLSALRAFQPLFRNLYTYFDTKVDCPILIALSEG